MTSNIVDGLLCSQQLGSEAQVSMGGLESNAEEAGQDD